MQITKFEISQDRTEINIIIEDASDVTALNFWTSYDFKDYTKSVDLYDYTSGDDTDNITVSLSELGLTYFDGVYFLEAQSTGETSQTLTADLTRYKECILNKLIEYSVCEDCLKTKSVSLLNAQGLLTGLETAVEQGFVDEIGLIQTSLDKYCSDACKSCGEYQNVVSNTYYNTAIIEDNDNGLTAFDISSDPYNICGGLTPRINLTVYHNGSGEYPVIGDIIYSDEQGENLYTTKYIYVVYGDMDVPMGIEGDLTIDSDSTVVANPGCE